MAHLNKSWFYRSEHNNGGVAIYADKNLNNIEPVHVSDFCAEFDIELTAVKVTDLNVLVLSAYRPPSGSTDVF